MLLELLVNKLLFLVKMNHQTRFYSYLLLLSCLTSNSWAAIIQDPTTSSKDSNSQYQWTIATSNNFPPVNLLDGEGQLSGFAKDISTAVANSVGASVNYVHSSRWPEVVELLTSGAADLIDDTGYTEDRDKFMDFTTPILSMDEVLFVRANQFGISDLHSLYGRTIACVDRHISHLYLKKFPQLICHVVNTPAEALIALLTDEVDAILYPKQVLIYLAKQLQFSHQIKIVGDPVRTLNWSMAVQQDNVQLLNQLNLGISKIRASGEYDRIYKHWFGNNVLSEYSKRVKQTYLLISIFIALLFGLSIYSYKTKKSRQELLDLVNHLRKTQDQLQTSESNYRTLVDNLPQRIFLKDSQSVYISCNKNYANDLGITPEEIAGNTDFDFNPEDAEQFQHGDQEVIKSGKSMEFIEEYNKGGREWTVRVTKTPIIDEQGINKGVLGIFWDITERKRIEQELQKQIVFFEAVVRDVPDALLLTNTDYEIIMCNPAFSRIFGYSSDELLGQSTACLYGDNNSFNLKKSNVDRFREDKTIAPIIVKLKRRGGEIFSGESVSTTVKDKNGNILGVIDVIRDISVRLGKEEERVNLQKQLQHVQKMEALGQLTGGIAHDFNNILAAVTGYTELAIEQYKKIDDEVFKDYLREVCKASYRARDLIKQMLTFSRGNQSDFSLVALHPIIKESTKLLLSTLPSTISVFSEIDSDTPMVNSDAVKIQQILLNLCINARDAMNGRGRITIKTQEHNNLNRKCSSCHEGFSGDFIELSITDTGSGIDVGTLDRIFEPFFSTKETGKGTGMGLAMVHGIMHEYGGHIAVTSLPGKGTTFNLLFPKPETNEKQISNFQNTNFSIAKSEINKHVMVIDDEKTVAKFESELLKFHGYEVTTMTQSQKALEAFTRAPDDFDLVVTDQTMPELTGSELAAKFLEIRPDIPIILCTGYSSSIDEAESLKAGFKAYLSKPFNSTQLLSLVAELLTNKPSQEKIA